MTHNSHASHETKRITVSKLEIGEKRKNFAQALKRTPRLLEIDFAVCYPDSGLLLLKPYLVFPVQH